MRLVLLALALAMGSFSWPRLGIAQQPTVSTGNGFWAQCGNPVDKTAALMCIAYVYGLADGMVAHPALKCLPAKITYQQRLDILLKYLREHPEVRHMPTSAIYVVSLLEALPCAE